MCSLQCPTVRHFFVCVCVCGGGGGGVTLIRTWMLGNFFGLRVGAYHILLELFQAGSTRGGG